MPPQVRTSGQAFGQTLFKGLGNVLSNIPQVINAQKQQMQADAIERFKVGIQMMQFQRQQQESRANILRLNSISRVNNLRAQELALVKPTPEEKAELARKIATAEAAGKVEAFTGFLGSEAGKNTISGLGGRGLSISGLGSITNVPASGVRSLTGNAAFIREKLGDEGVLNYLLFGVEKTQEEVALMFVRQGLSNPLLSGLGNTGRFGLNQEFLDDIKGLTGIDINTLQLPPSPLLNLSPEPGNAGETDKERTQRLKDEIKALEDRLNKRPGQ